MMEDNWSIKLNSEHKGNNHTVSIELERVLSHTFISIAEHDVKNKSIP